MYDQELVAFMNIYQFFFRKQFSTISIVLKSTILIHKYSPVSSGCRKTPIGIDKPIIDHILYILFLQVRRLPDRDGVVATW